LPGFETEREEWERQYAEAHARYEEHQRQIREQAAAVEAAAQASESVSSYESHPDEQAESSPLAGDEALSELRDQLADEQPSEGEQSAE